MGVNGSETGKLPAKRKLSPESCTALQLYQKSEDKRWEIPENWNWKDEG